MGVKDFLFNLVAFLVVKNVTNIVTNKDAVGIDISHFVHAAAEKNARAVRDKDYSSVLHFIIEVVRAYCKVCLVYIVWDGPAPDSKKTEKATRAADAARAEEQLKAAQKDLAELNEDDDDYSKNKKRIDERVRKALVGTMKVLPGDLVPWLKVQLESDYARSRDQYKHECIPVDGLFSLFNI